MKRCSAQTRGLENKTLKVVGTRESIESLIQIVSIHFFWFLTMKYSTSAMFRAIIQFTDLFTFIDTKYCYFLCAAMTSTKSPRGKGYSQNSWVGLCGLFLKTLTQLMTKSVIFFLPLFMTWNSISCLWPLQLIVALNII